ncbi:MAG: hypothetical protein NTV86_08130 [Planctomycetota bacterium]|nr:hypothetical protein [Planctomycetota bacterium]
MTRYGTTRRALWLLGAGLALAAPGRAAAQEAPARTWAFTPPRDTFSPEAVLDLRDLNEKTAGESGFVSRSADGNDFVLGNGKPARFWAVNDAAFEKDLARHAPTGELLAGIDQKERDRLWRQVAAMKKEGIYVTWSPYWAGPARVKPAMGVLDSGGNGNWGLLFFDKKLQDAYKGWLKQVLAETNPYTRLPLARDGALAIIQIQNEDSLLFYTAQGIKGAARAELRRQFGRFVLTKYGSFDKARQAWGGAAPSPDQDAPDDFARGEAALMIAWELSQHRFGEGFQKRCSDQMQFLAETMHRFNRMIGDYLRKDLGCKQLVNAGNWRTADNVVMLDAERWSYSANELMAVNRYFDGAHEGRFNGWAIVNGDTFTDPSVLLRPRELPVALKQVEGFPMMVTESSWVPPLSHQSEGPMLVAAYQSLSGVDAFYWFATSEEDWRQPGSANGFLPSEGKWVCATPMLLGQWPAAALMYRLGYVARGKPVVREERSLEDLWQRRMPIIAEDAGYDVNRDKDSLSKLSNVKNGVNPLAYLVGPVTVKYGGNPARSMAADLRPYVDEAKKTVRSITGEIEMDYGRGLCTLNAPRAQGVTGFLKKVGTFTLADLTIASGNEYATVLAVSMDERPLKTSRRVLVQVGTIQRPTGWQTRPAKVGAQDGQEVVSFGKAPWQIVKGDVTVTIRNPGLKAAVILDANGMPLGRAALEATRDGATLTFPPEALYVVLE